MNKYFWEWCIQKEKTHREDKKIIFYEREVWWCALGVNIGVEIDGKHELFLRPVLILRKFNKDMALVIPTSSNPKAGKYYFDASCEDGKSYHLRLSQMRTISGKRLFRKMGTVNQISYKVVIEKVVEMVKGTLTNNDTTFSGGVSEAEAHNVINDINERK